MQQLQLWSEATTRPEPAPAPARLQPVRARSGFELRAALEVAAAAGQDTLDATMAQYFRHTRSERTRLVYQSCWTGFERWCTDAGERALPASSQTLARYLTHLAASGRKYSTIRHCRSAIGMVHRWAGQPRPDQDWRIRELERGIARTHGAREQGPEPLLAEHLPAIVATVSDTARDQRDRALLLLGFAGAYRASDLATLDIEHVSTRPDGLLVLLPRSKDDQEGQGARTLIPPAATPALCPVRAVLDWIARVGRPQGPLFRSVRGATVEPHRIHPRAVARAVQRLVARAGLPGHYSAHSLRSGLATSAYARGASEREIQAHGRWKDRRSLDRYIDTPRIAAARGSVLQGLL